MYNQITANKRQSLLLMLLFVGVVFALGLIAGYAFGDLHTGLILAGCISIGFTLLGYFQGDTVALAVSGAKRIERRDHETLYRLTENLAIAQGIPTPTIYLIEDSSPNAFATGRNPKTASIAITTGLLSILEKTELEGVLAHELSHIKNFDTRYMTLVVVLVGTVALLSDLITRNVFFRSRDRDDRGGNGVLLLIGILFAILSPLIAQLLKLAVSRQREYLADASAALLTRYPEGLARALQKIAAMDQPLKHANHATAHLYLANPFDPHVTTKRRLDHLFATHPPIEDRIARLRSMA